MPLICSIKIVNIDIKNKKALKLKIFVIRPTRKLFERLLFSFELLFSSNESVLRPIKIR
jgi:hypothetical protein